MEVLLRPKGSHYERIAINKRNQKHLENSPIYSMWRTRLMKEVSFYGKSSPTAKNGHQKHPKGIKPTHRPN